jgi:hypothetical protein
VPHANELAGEHEARLTTEAQRHREDKRVF